MLIPRMLIPRMLIPKVLTDGCFDHPGGHSSPITAVDLSPDETVIATGSYDGQVLKWTPGAEPECMLRTGHLVNNVRFNASGSVLACAVADGRAYFVDADQYSIVGVAGPFEDDVNAVVWRPSHDSEVAIVADTFDPVVHLWDVRLGRESGRLVGHEDCVCGAAFDKDGGRLATAGEDGTARIWDVERATCIAVLGHPNDPESIDWSRDSKYIVTGCNDGVLRLFDGSDYSLVGSNESATAAVRFVRFAPDGASLLAGSYDAHLRRLKVPTLEVIEVLQSNWQWERSAASGASRTVVGSFGSAPVVFTPDGVRLNDGGRTIGINALDSRSDGDDLHVYVGRDDGAVVDVLLRAELYRHDSIVNAVSISPDARQVASCDYRGRAVVWSVGGLTHDRAFVGTGPLNTCVWLDDARLVLAGYSGEILWWDLERDAVSRLRAHHGPVKSLTVDPASRRLIAGSSDHSVSIWDGTTLVARGTDEDLSLVNGVSVCVAGSSFVSCSRDAILRVWDMETAKVADRLPRAHLRSVKAVDSANGGDRILSGSYDGRGVWWERCDGRWHWRYLDLHGVPGVPAVKLAGDIGLTAGWDGSVGMWRCDGRLIERVALDSLACVPSGAAPA